MTRVVTALFDTIAQAEAAVVKLAALGVPRSDISVIAHGAGAGLEGLADDTGKGAGLGTMIGGSGGLLASLGLVAIPGIGPVVAGGWLAALAVGAVVGAAAGGLVGALVHAGIAEGDAHVYAEGVRRGGALLTAQVADADADAAEASVHGAADVGDRGNKYRQRGWVRFDDTAAPLDRAQIESERGSHLFV